MGDGFSRLDGRAAEGSAGSADGAGAAGGSSDACGAAAGLGGGISMAATVAGFCSGPGFTAMYTIPEAINAPVMKADSIFQFIINFNPSGILNVGRPVYVS